MALLDNLIAYWKLDETSGTRSDSHGSNHLSVNGLPGTAAGPANLGNGVAINDAVAPVQYLYRADNADLSAGDIDFTVQAWFYLTDNTGNRGLVAKWDSSGSVATCEYSLRYLTGPDRIEWRVGDGSTNTTLHADTLGSPSLNTWYHAVAWHDASANQIGIAINAGTADTASHSTGVLDATGDFAVGRPGAFAGQYWDGRLDGVALWKRVLSSTERSDLYNAGAGLEYPFGSLVRVRKRKSILVPEPTFDFSW